MISKESRLRSTARVDRQRSMSCALCWVLCGIVIFFSSISVTLSCGALVSIRDNANVPSVPAEYLTMERSRGYSAKVTIFIAIINIFFMVILSRKIYQATSVNLEIPNSRLEFMLICAAFVAITLCLCDIILLF